MSRPIYRSPAVRAHRYRGDLPKVVTVHENRFLAAGLLEALKGEAEVVADTAYGAAALQLADMLSPDVVVAGELFGDGLIDHFLPQLVRAGTRVLLVTETIQESAPLSYWPRACPECAPRTMVWRTWLRRCSMPPTEGVVLPPPLAASIVVEWRSQRHRGGVATPGKLTMREMEVLNAMADGLSTKAAARLLGVATKTVETHKTRVFAKLGVRSQSQLVAVTTGRGPERPVR